MHLKKELGLFGVFCIASGAMISSGIFILPALAFAKAGPSLIISYLVAAILVVPAMFSKAELTTAMPKAGGTYFFLDRTFGPAFGTLAGISSWFSISLKSAFALLGIGFFATLIYPELSPLQIKLIAIGFCALFCLINLVGVGHANKAQIVLVVLILMSLVVYSFFGFNDINIGNFKPFAPNGYISILATAGFVFVSYAGLTKIASVAEEVKNPSKNIPTGMILALIVVTALYLVVIFITVGLLSPAEITNSMTPLSLAAMKSMGNFGFILLSLAAIMAFVTTANAGILAASRDLMAMSRDSLLPNSFALVSKKFKTPHVAIIFTAVFMIFVISFLGLEHLVKTASTLIILLFISVNISVVIMRESKIPQYKPSFKSPFYPWMQVFGVVASLFLLVEMGTLPLLIAGLMLTASFVWYWLFAKEHVRRESALICLIQRVANRKLPCDNLGSELREIIHERDDIVRDRFDHLVQDAQIIDIEGSISAESAFQQIADHLTDSLKLKSDLIYKMLLDREKESSTVLATGFAVPHIIVEGDDIFELVMVRAKDGVLFPTEAEPVHAFFVLAGSRDERNFHLRVLMAIAQIEQSEGFMEKWIAARTEQELKDIILLVDRQRNH